MLRSIMTTWTITELNLLQNPDLSLGKKTILLELVSSYYSNILPR